MKGCEQRTKYHCYDVLEHTAWAVQAAAPTRLVRWAALCHDMGKPASEFYGEDGVVHFYGHAHVSAQLAHGLLSRLLMSGAFVNSVCTLILNHSEKTTSSPRSVKRALARIGGDVELFRGLLALKRADILAHAPEYRDQAAVIDEVERMLDDILAQEQAFSVKHLAIDGKDIIALGVPQGPAVGDMLQQALDAVIDGRVENERDALLAFVQSSVS